MKADGNVCSSDETINSALAEWRERRAQLAGYEDSDEGTELMSDISNGCYDVLVEVRIRHPETGALIAAGQAIGFKNAVLDLAHDDGAELDLY